MECACGTPALVVAGVAAADGLRRVTRCAGAGARWERAEVAAALALALFVGLYVLCPASLAAGPLAAAFCVLLWPNGQLRPEERRHPKAPAGDYRRVDWRAATADCPCTGDLYLVIGAGFFGKRLVRRLRERGDRVRVLDLCPDPFGAAEGIDYIRGNALNERDLQRALAGVDCVFATFAAVRFMDRLDCQTAFTYKINVTAMDRVLEAAKAAGVKRIVQTSTSHVIAAVGMIRPVMDETDQYVTRERSHNHYSWTKALSEQRVLAANTDAMKTCAVRPCSAIFGASDHAVCDLMKGPVISAPFAAARTDYVYVDNVVLGHLKADARLREGATGVAGEAFCVSNEDPMSWDDLGRLVGGHAKKRINVIFPLPSLLCYVFPRVLEAVTWLTSGRVTFVSLGLGLELFTPACLETASMNFAVDITKARTRLNYQPCWTVEQGVQQMVAEWEGRSDAGAVFDLGSDSEGSPARRTPSDGSSDGISSEIQTCSSDE
eukprot:TRINITY_DN483_c0_g2_i4.p2 TRINITY_DN483_c0_g2~~TRINITY_DN483_c0_g2_i4.p2  ORF type:complete len:512 (+),score=180.07 TRINITY_DN483_c0_g2_i4:61-1536(+)